MACEISNAAEYSRGQVFHPADVVAYRPGTVVSRTLLDRETGTVTLFSFDKGEGLCAHSAPYDALVQALDGEVEISIAGKARRVKAGEMIILPAGRPHALKAVERFKMALVTIRS